MKSLSAIAKDLGVSTATVSYVYHDKWRENRIRPELADRVRRKLEEERGRPDFLGRQLRSGRTQTVGLMLPQLDQPYFLSLLAGIERRLAESDYMLFLGISHLRREGRQVELLERMLDRKADALILSPRPSPDLTALLGSIRESGAPPVVFVDNYIPDQGLPHAVSDNRWGARQVTLRALADGRRRVLFVGGSPEIAALADRCAGYREALAEAGAEAREKWVVWRESLGARFDSSLRSLLTGRSRPDAIFCDSLFGCQPIVALLHEIGLRHPDDVLLCGFDHPPVGSETRAFRETIRAPLLAARQNAEAMGTAAAELALREIEGGRGRRFRLIRPVLSWGRLR